jgi:hypothetical protein
LLSVADAEPVPFSYVVDDVSFTVTFSPADVSSTKPDFATLVTFPIEPPAAGPERALEPPVPDPDGAACAAVVVVVVAASALDVSPHAESPAAAISSPGGTHPRLLRESTRRTLERPGGCPGVTLGSGLRVWS